MKNQRTSKKFNVSAGNQRGVYTVVVAMLLIGVSMLAVRGVMRSALVETRIANNETQIKEVQQAAEATWHYGLAWYAKNEPPWVDDPGGTTVQYYVLPNVPSVAASNGDTYSGNVTYYRDSTNPLSEGYALIVATATAVNDTATTATVRQFVHDNLLAADPGFSNAPLVVLGCMTNTTGTPDVNVGSTIDPDTGAAIPGTAVLSLEASDTMVGTDPCIDPGHLDVFYEDPNNEGVGLEVDWDVTEELNAAIDYATPAGGTAPTDLWPYIFTLDRPTMEDIAQEQLSWPAEDREVIWVYPDSTDYLSSDNYCNSCPQGTADKPIIIIFDESFVNPPPGTCPGFQGNQTIWGIVFMDGDCPDGNGWGQVTINGTAAINGSIDQLNSNTEFNKMDIAGGDDANQIKSPWVARLAGSWRDF